MTELNRRWFLARRPVGIAGPQDMEYQEGSIDLSAPIPADHILVRNMVFQHAPTMRNWMDGPSNSLYPSIPLGSPVLATAAGVVVASTDERFPVGCRVTTIGDWQDYSLVPSTIMPVRRVPDGLSMIDCSGALGMNALTAYMGVTKVGRVVAGDRVVVSGAAGSTGSTAGQICRILGAEVVGVVGSKEKCDYLVRDLGFTGAINYREGDLEAQIRAAYPDGVTMFFDNVGGEVLQAVVENTAKFARIVLCGQIAAYSDSGPVQGPTNMMRFVYGSVTMQGYLLGDYEADVPAAREQLKAWVDEGRLIHREDIRSGFDQIPATFGDLFTGRNDGTLLVVTDEGAYATSDG